MDNAILYAPIVAVVLVLVAAFGLRTSRGQAEVDPDDGLVTLGSGLRGFGCGYMRYYSRKYGSPQEGGDKHVQ